MESWRYRFYYSAIKNDSSAILSGGPGIWASGLTTPLVEWSHFFDLPMRKISV
jgi:hypothetical protein